MVWLAGWFVVISVCLPLSPGPIIAGYYLVISKQSQMCHHIYISDKTEPSGHIENRNNFNNFCFKIVKEKLWKISVIFINKILFFL